MAHINALNPSITNLSLLEQIQLIKANRLSRRTSKFVPKKKRAKAKRKPAKQKTLKELAALMSPQQKALLRAQLLGA